MVSQVHDLACSLVERAMPGAPADLVQQQIERLAVGSFDQCCATVLRAVQAVADGRQAGATGSYIFNSDCSNRPGYHWIALHYEVAVAPPAPGAGLVCPSAASGGAVGAAGPGSGVAISALAGRPPLDAGPSVPELAPALATLASAAAATREPEAAAGDVDGAGEDGLLALLEAASRKRGRDGAAMLVRADADTERSTISEACIDPGLEMSAPKRRAEPEATDGAAPLGSF